MPYVQYYLLQVQKIATPTSTRTTAHNSNAVTATVNSSSAAAVETPKSEEQPVKVQEKMAVEKNDGTVQQLAVATVKPAVTSVSFVGQQQAKKLLGDGLMKNVVKVAPLTNTSQATLMNQPGAKMKVVSAVMPQTSVVGIQQRQTVVAKSTVVTQPLNKVVTIVGGDRQQQQVQVQPIQVTQQQIQQIKTIPQQRQSPQPVQQQIIYPMQSSESSTGHIETDKQGIKVGIRLQLCSVFRRLGCRVSDPWRCPWGRTFRTSAAKNAGN